MNQLFLPNVPQNDPNTEYPSSECQVVFFRVFNLADFFAAPSKGGASSSDTQSVHFLKNRTGKMSQSLFSYYDLGKYKTPLWQALYQEERVAVDWEPDHTRKEEEERAYAAGWVRGSLLNRFFAPTYKYKKPVFDVIPTERPVECICSFYHDEWVRPSEPIRAYLDNARLFLMMSPYGIASARLELSVPVDTPLGMGVGAEFREIQAKLTPLFSSEHENKLKEILKSLSRDVVHYPSFLSFIALSAIWQFLHGLEQRKPRMSCLEKWWEGSGCLKSFDKIWERSTARPFPLRHEAAYYYFQSDRYEQKPLDLSPTKADLDGICQLGLFVSSSQASRSTKASGLFANEVKESLDNKDLCVTDNGFAYVVGASLVVAVKNQRYTLQGNRVTEKAYWRWMFRLLCCMRECFMLCDISSEDVRKLRERYELRRPPWFQSLDSTDVEKEIGDLFDELAQVASLLFTVEEGSHSVTASRVPFVQEKLRTFVDQLGLSDLLDNVNKRRQRLEERLHNEMSRLSQRYMERIADESKSLANQGVTIAKESKKVSKWSMVIAGISLVVSIGGYCQSKNAEDEHNKERTKLDKKHAKEQKELLEAIQSLSKNKEVSNISEYARQSAQSLKRIEEKNSSLTPNAVRNESELKK